MSGVGGSGVLYCAALLTLFVVYGDDALFDDDGGGVTTGELSERVALHIGGTFPMESDGGGWAGGQACLPAVQMALEDVNKRPDILDGYELVLHYYDSKCQPGLAAKYMYELLYKPPVKLMLLAGCSPVTTTVAEAVPVWNMIVLSYGASSPALSNRDRFPTLFRTHPSANLQNPTRVRLFQKFNWKKITILQSVEEVFTSNAKDLEIQCREKGIKVNRQSFYGNPADAVKTMIRQDARIIVGLYYENEARKVLCEAYKNKLYGRKYVWFLIGWFSDTWYIPPKEEHLNCTAQQMAEAAQFHFTTESIMLSRENKVTISGMTGVEFRDRLENQLNTDPADTAGFPEAPLAYDAVWAMALAFNCTMAKLTVDRMKLEDFDYHNDFMYKQLFNCMKDTRFPGVSGEVMFSDLGDRIARTQIEQMQGGKYIMMGTYDSGEQKLDWRNKEMFAGGRGPPPDSTITRDWLLTVSIELYYAVVVFAVIGAIGAMVSFIFNSKYSYRGFIEQSQPQCNNVMAAGCILCFISLLLMGLPAEGIVVPKDSFTLLCHSRIGILMIGFTFAYGSMFAKVWIVHRMGATENQELATAQRAKEEEEGINLPWEGIRALIATMVGRPALEAAARLRKVSSNAYGSLIGRRSYLLNQPVPPWKFYMVIIFFFIIDIVIIAAWILFDPLERKERRFPLQEPPAGTEDDVMLSPILELCQSEHQEVWIGLIMGYKCLLLVFGLFLAYESRNLKLRYVNDSRFVSLAIYNVAILSLVTGPVVTLLIRSEANANFAFVSVTVLLCAYISLGLVFAPKMAYIYRVPHSKDEQGGGLSRSKLTRAEQNRFQQLLVENDELKKQIEIKETKITECRTLLERRLAEISSRNGSTSMVSHIAPSVSDDAQSSSPPTTLTTTAHIEQHPKASEMPVIEYSSGYKSLTHTDIKNTPPNTPDDVLL
uniref:G-protein coupled receptors family 3 profile domain-containing protein n=1 Tax=Plectus sambesii TaxID=2011161 RepID=A0A914UIZ6_9BILA